MVAKRITRKPPSIGADISRSFGRSMMFYGSGRTRIFSSISAKTAPDILASERLREDSLMSIWWLSRIEKYLSTLIGGGGVKAF